MPRTFARLAFALLLFMAARPALAAGPVSEDVPLPGGTQALARILGVEPAPDRARALAEFARLIHSVPEGTNGETDQRLQRLLSHGNAVAQFQTALVAIQPKDGGIALSMAASKNDRKRLADFLDLLGLRLRERKKTFSVEQRKDKDGAERVRLLAEVGLDVGPLAGRLNAGETVRLEVPVETVPVPFGTAFWSTAIFRQPVQERDLVTAILVDRNASLLCRGLASLDDETLQFLADHPAIVRDLYESRAAAFAAFGDSLSIRGGRVATPGGPAPTGQWEAVLDESTTRPDRFIREVFGRDDGRFAYFYDTVYHLDPARRAFALGSWIQNASLRRERFIALVSASVDSVRAWDIARRPFFRPPFDAAMLLASVRASETGAPVEPAARRLWSRAFEGTDLPDNPGRELRKLDEEGVVDAAWLVEQLASEDAAGNRQRLEQIEFGQRLFSSAPADQLADVLVALRALPHVPMLLQSLGRSGVRTPAIYAAVARQAGALTALDPDRAVVAVGQYQGAIALAGQLASVGTLTPAQVEALVGALAQVPLDDNGRFAGGLAGWLLDTLAPMLAARGPFSEASLVDGAAGVRGADAPAPRVVTWEERAYRIDPAGATARHVRRIREAQSGVSLDVVLELDRIRRSLASRTISLPDVRTASEAIGKVFGTIRPVKLAAQERPPGIDAPPDISQGLTRAMRDLSKISRPKDVQDAARVANRLTDIVDRTLADTLVSLAYAWALADAENPTVAAGTVALRHDFGFGGANGDARRRTLWQQPQQDLAPGRPWRVKGSLLGLDVALAELSLRRLSTDGVSVPTIGGNDVLTFTRSFALLNPRDMSDADQAALAAAIAAGQQRVHDLAARPDDFDTLAAEIDMDGWRRRAARWSLAHDRERVATYFSAEEWLRLGHLDPSVHLGAWGMAQPASRDCLCLSLDEQVSWWSVAGREQLGELPAEVPDLHLRVASVMQTLGLPAALTRHIVAIMLRTYLDSVRQSDGDDWLALVRAAQATSRESIEDAVAALTADGPLVPIAAATASNQR